MLPPLEESRYAFTVPPLVEGVPAARERVAVRAGRLGLSLSEELIYDLKLLTGELVANSVTHTKAACVVCVRWTGERLRVEVTDVDPIAAAPSQASSMDEHGRGLVLVATLATEWGSEPCTAGKKTWFELAVQDFAGGTAAASLSHSDVTAEESAPIADARVRIAHQAA
ncbi:anti-sigma regulatory factor (Ser/Thr protein kinase) [Streptomyces sp. LBL]|uniref:ATP-binding protein n=1 Tax=Streptomyces sp. LBL TaxID=2940562 RepID=UPI0024734D70|nr:ATP-binding protein [Streptomyces sp. LBL]MDH6624388.1 anti-sigma regulatory factor (Ser/Thr protein kinase) [Streptomyces sp. LBL]